jgi:hypothetical protein
MKDVAANSTERRLDVGGRYHLPMDDSIRQIGRVSRQRLHYTVA